MKTKNEVVGKTVTKNISLVTLPNKGKVTLKKEKSTTLHENIGNVLVYNNPIKKVTAKDRPKNVLDKKPHEHDAISLVDIVNNFCEEGVLEELEEFLVEHDKFEALSYNDYAKEEKLALKILLSALAVQRPISMRQLRKIQINYNHLKVQTPIVLKIKHKGKLYYYIVDGQHTAATQGIRARLGLLKEVNKENWEDVLIRCSVIECDNFTFAREIFLGVNGDDKLDLVYFDKWKNYVLGARQDGADDEFWQDCLDLQEILEEHNITPIHEGETEQVKRMPGAFVNVHLIEDKSPADVRWISKVHQMLWDDKPMDSFEVDPMLLLKEKIKKDPSLDNKQIVSFLKELGNLIRNTAGSPAGWKKFTQKTYPLWFRETHPEEADKKISIPDDASLALLLFAYQEAGGKFKDLRLTFLKEKFTKRNETLFDYLSQDGKEIDENLKSMIRGVKDIE